MGIEACYVYSITEKCFMFEIKDSVWLQEGSKASFFAMP